jgi:polyphenol oxidase
MSLDFITAEVLSSITHGFFTRKGGVSSGIYHGLNCDFGSGDTTKNVRTNRSQVATSVGVDDTCLVSLYQTHSTNVITAHGEFDIPPSGDAIVTNQPGLALAILTADCQPVLFCDPQAEVIGAAHAGWRGALDGILENTLAAMVNLGAKREQIAAVIGPSISQPAYEVGPEFFETFLAKDQDNAQFFANGDGDRFLFNLTGYGLLRLRNAGVGQATWTGHCTYSDPETFYSFRHATHQSETDYGRLVSVIRL